MWKTERNRGTDREWNPRGRAALKCWKVFRCVRANRSVKAPYLTERSRLRVYKAWRNGMKGFSAGWHTQRVGISRIFVENLWLIPEVQLNRLTLSPCRLTMIEERTWREIFFVNHPSRHWVIVKERALVIYNLMYLPRAIYTDRYTFSYFVISLCNFIKLSSRKQIKYNRT